MAQIFDVREETADLVAKISQETNLYNYANIEPLAISKQPVLIKVAKANAATEFKCQTTDLVFLYIYEDAFEKLTDEQKDLMVREAMNQITKGKSKKAHSFRDGMNCVSLSLLV